MERSDLSQRLGLSIPYEWWPTAPILKEIEAAGFGWVQVPSPPASVLTDEGACARHALALRAALDTSGLSLMLHAPGSLQAGRPGSDLALEGLVSHASEAGAPLVIYHAANFPDAPSSEDAVLAETRSLAAIARRAERLGVTLALENLAPVFPGPDARSFNPHALRTMAIRIDSPAVALCLDVGHAHLVAALRRTGLTELIEPVLDRVAVFHLHDNLGARRDPESRPELDPARLDLHLPLGRGMVPWAEVAPLLDRAPEAPLLLEIHPPRPAASQLFGGAHDALVGRVPARA
jgi:sugar phosphate isomerase/epimerase